MIKVICTSIARLPAQLAEGERAFTYFKSARREGVGTIAKSWHGSLKRKGFRPTPAAWDFVQFCLAVCATDLCAMRSTSADGWTRTIELSVGLHEPMRWGPWKVELEQLLKVLTGDYWTLIFTDAGLPPPSRTFHRQESRLRFLVVWWPRQPYRWHGSRGPRPPASVCFSAGSRGL